MHDWGPGVGMRWETTESAEDTDGALLVGTMWFAPGMAGPPVHVHPHAEERFTVLEGEAEVLLDGTWRRVTAGETAVVPIGARHSVRNLSAFPAKVVNTHSPALRMEGFFVDGARLAAADKITALSPRNAKSAIYAAMLFTKYPEEIVAAGPPRLIFRALSAVGRTLGWRV
ncbi:cupin domain-containing protein [Patulibacter minatonensis]|uniref:cupin domain-containing protein n=1 Tax=Patulibacter minatonensis TaxID=298163 RepID=UPI0012F9C810|nr:cupin domain-containing protein [Patulibacter minatonensis]